MKRILLLVFIATPVIKIDKSTIINTRPRGEIGRHKGLKTKSHIFYLRLQPTTNI